MKKITVLFIITFIITIFYSMNLFSQEILIIGDINSSTNSPYTPFYRYYNYNASSVLYLQSELGEGKKITHIAFDKVSGNTTMTIENAQIWARHITETSLSTPYTYNTDDYSLIWEGEFPNDNATGWHEVELDAPFVYNGTDNLQLLIIKDYQSYASGYPYWRFSVTSTTQHIYSFSDGSLPTGLTNSMSSKPNIRLKYYLLLPELEYPVDNTIISSLEPLFNWVDFDGATSYILQVSLDSDFENLIINEDEINVSEYQSSVLDYDTEYFWRVRAVSDGVNSEWSEIWNFEIQFLPPDLIYPENNTVITDLFPDFEWSEVYNATNYNIQVSQNSDFSDNIIDETVTQTSFTPPTSFEYNIEYFWRVQTINDGESSEWSDVWNFEIQYLPPDLNYPENNDIITELQPVFNWAEISSATSYTIQVSLHQDFSQNLIEEDLSTTSYSPDTDLRYYTKYYWRVKAQNDEIESNWSDTWNFEIIYNGPGYLWTWGYNNYGQLGNGTYTNQYSPIQIGDDDSWVAISGGNYHTVGIKSDGTLWAWGYNYYGQLGDGTNTNRNEPVQIGEDTDWALISCGDYHTVGIKIDGTLWVWGYNYYGQLGDGTNTNRNEPVQIGEDTDWALISCGGYHTVGIKSDGTLLVWGKNEYGQLGDGTNTNRNEPVQIGEDTDWSSISCGEYNTISVKSDGTLWAWGFNEQGQLGDGSTTNRISPVHIGEDTDWSSVTCGLFHTIGIKSDGTLWAWGDNYFGQLGDATNSSRNIPIQIGEDTDWASISCGNYHSLSIKSDGSLWTWGSNVYGQLGDGTTVNKNVPVMIGNSGMKWILSGSGYQHTFAIASPMLFAPYLYVPENNSVFNNLQPEFTWTDINYATNYTFQLSESSDFSELLYNETLTDATFTPDTDLEYDTEYFWRVMANNDSENSLWSSVWSFELEFFPPELVYPSNETKLMVPNFSYNWNEVNNAVEYTIQISKYEDFSQILVNETLSGTNFTPDIDYAYDTEYFWRVMAHNDDISSEWSEVYSFEKLNVEPGYLWAWGYNYYGQLGDGTNTTSNAPVQIGDDDNWVVLSGGYYHSVGIKSDGTLWSWGYNGSGQLGDGTNTARNTPVQIGDDNDWLSVSTGMFHGVAIKTNGTIWSWGSNGSGQLGDGTNTNRNAPVQIGEDTDWVTVSCGSNHNVGIKSDGTLWAWGYNNYGQLGDGTTNNSNVPVQIGEDTDWISISCGSSHNLGIKIDGTLWSWGYNNSSQLGDGSNILINYPIQIGDDDNWLSVSCGGFYSVGIKTNGTLWGWGDNSSGQLGEGSTKIYRIPHKINEESQWKSIICGSYHTIGIKNDGTLWAWGANSSGQLGDGSNAIKYTPVQIGKNCKWHVNGSGYSQSFAIASTDLFAPYLYLPENNQIINNLQPDFTWNELAYASSYTLQVSTNSDFSDNVIDETLSTTTFTPATNLEYDTEYFWRVMAHNDNEDSDWSEVWSFELEFLPPVLIAPANNIVNSMHTPDFEWNEVTNASSYTLQVSDNSDFSHTIIDESLASTTYTPENPLDYDTEYFWRVMAHNDSEDSDWSEVWSFEIRLDTPVLTAPLNNSIITDLKPGFAWNSVSDAGTYTIQVSENSDFSNNIVDETLASTTYTPQNQLNYDTKYFWRVKANNGVNSSDWCGSWQFEIQLYAPELDYPAHNDIITDMTPDFGWNETDNASNYTIQISTVSSFAETVIEETVSNTTYTPGSDLNSDFMYFWRVRSNDENDESEWSEIRRFELLGSMPSSEGNLYGFGSISEGQLGIGLSENSPLIIGEETDWVSISSGQYHTLAIKSDGTLWAWGYNNYGQLGDGTNINYHVPVQIGADTDWSTVTCGSNHTLGIKSDGTLWAWGYNAYGQLGDGTTITRYIPVQIGTDTDWSTVTCGSNHTIGIKSDGTLWAWGYNSYGQLGDGTNTNRTTPVQIGAGIDWSTVSCGYYHTMATKNNGTLWAWGLNSHGELGDGTNTNRYFPVQIGTGTDWSTIACGYYHTLATKNNGTLWSWGYNSYGQLGDGTTTNRYFPVQIGTSTDWSSVSCGSFHTISIKNDGTLWSWGYNAYGQLGDGTNLNRIEPLQIGEETDWSSFYCGYYNTISIKTDGTLWSWGYNLYGQLGHDIGKEPTLVDDYDNWISIFCGTYHSIGIKEDGTLWAWGSNKYGQLGDGTNVNRNEPVQIGADTDWSSVSCGSYHTIGIKNDGTLWSWGLNTYGQLGDGTNVNRNEPVQIGADTDWSTISCGGYHTIGIKTDGTLWAWGYNAYGQLGNGTYTSSNVPIQIGNETNWANMSCGSNHAFAIKNNGSLWSWGYNYYGQLGDGTNTNSNIPMQISDDMDWKTVSCGSNHNISIKTDGSLWTWGLNNNGQLGDGTNTNSNIPAQISEDTDWSLVSCGGYFNVGIKTDGSLWTWGLNNNGQLGDGTISSSFVPINISRENYWTVAASGGYHNMAISGGVGTTVLLLPENESELLERQPEFVWLENTTATSYTIQLSDNSLFEDPIIDESVATNTFTPEPELDYNTVYFWRVMTHKGEINSKWSPIWNFEIKLLAPELLSPQTATEITDLQPDFSWNESVGASSYTIQISTTSDFSGTIINETILTTSFTPSTELTINTQYYWRVMAQDADTESEWSEVRNFEVFTIAPELISPENESTITGNSVYLEWNDLEDASYFHIQVSQNSDFSILHAEYENVEDIFVETDNLNPGGLYYWRVRAFDVSDNHTVWSETYVFSTNIPLGGTNGNDFWVSYMQNFDNSGVTLRLFISSLKNSTVFIENENTGWTEEVSISANETEIVEVPLASGLTSASEIVDNKGIHITSNNLISVFAGNYKQYTTDATVVLPTEFLGTEYIAMCYNGINSVNNPSEFMLLSTENNTNIEIIPTANTLGGILEGETINVQLDKGETYLIKSEYDLTGSYISSDKDVAVYSGHSCANVPTGYSACDHIYEQMYPVSTFGNEFIAIPLMSRVGSTIRVLASEDNTTLNIGNELITLNAYEYYEKMIYESVSISSDRPISVAQYSNGQSWDNVESDPFFIILSPSEMFINNVDFYAISTGAIERHFVNILAKSDCYYEIELDGVDIGSYFEPVSSNNNYYYAQIEVFEGNHSITSSSSNNCGFNASMYGFGPWDSYGYNAGISNGDIYISDIEIELTEETENYMEISHEIGTEFEISCTIQETVEPYVETVTLHYRNYEDEEGVYNTTSMNLNDGVWSAIIPSEESIYPGIQFYITANDGVLTYTKPEVQAEERPYNISVLVNYLPEVELLTFIRLVDSLLNTNIPVYATADDETDSLEEVKLFYRIKGSQEFDSIVMELEDEDNDLYVGSIPAESVTRNGLDYFVEAKDNLGLRKSTETVSCLLIGLPAPEQEYPTHNTTHITKDITFRWEDMDDVESYMIQIASDSTFNNIIYENNNILRDSIPIVDILLYSNTYYWRIRARYEFQYSDWSEIWKFTTRDEPLVSPELSSPEDMAVEVSLSPLCEWQAVNNATSYEIQIADDDSFETIVFEGNSTTNSIRVSSLDSLFEYFWRVRAMKNAEPGIWSDIWSFTTTDQEDKFVDLTMAYHGYYQNSEHIKMSVIVELREGDNLMQSTIVSKRAALLKTDGTAQLNFMDIDDGDYWIVVRATGYMPLAIPEKQTLSTIGITWDFTASSANSVAGPNVMRYVNGVWQVRPGDLDASRSVAAFDINYLIPNLGKSVSNQIPQIISNDAEYYTDVTGKLVSIDIIYNGYYNSNIHKKIPVTIDLMAGDVLTESDLVSSKPGIVDTDGNVEIDFADIADGDYWIIVRASGYMPLAIPEKQTLSSNGIMWDFTTSSDNSVAGTNVMRYISGVWQVRGGDFDASRSVAAFDINYLIPNLGKSVSSQIPE